MYPMTTYHHGDLRAAMLKTARAIVEKEGVRGLRMREAARRAGVSHTAPYRHFPDLEALLGALAAQGVADLLQALDGRTGRDLAEAYVSFALAHPQLFRLMFAGRRWPQLEARFGNAFAEVGTSGAAAAWSLVHGLAHLLLDGHFAEEGRAFASRVIAALRFAQRAA
jgi:AcrR family transcriptional regulator